MILVRRKKKLEEEGGFGADNGVPAISNEPPLSPSPSKNTSQPSLPHLRSPNPAAT